MSGPFVPFENWPAATRQALAAAYTIKADAAAGRIREQVRTSPCSCFRPGERLLDGRCDRCYGLHPEGQA